MTKRQYEKASIKALKIIPFQRRWAEELQSLQPKMEISGTSQIEGAEFDSALNAETYEELLARTMTSPGLFNVEQRGWDLIRS